MAVETSLISVLPNLSIGVISIGALVYVSNRFLTHLDKRATQHEESMAERELALRTVEQEVRNSVLSQIAENTHMLSETSRALERVINHLDNSSNKK